MSCIFCLLQESKLIELVRIADALLLVQTWELAMKMSMGFMSLYL